MKHSLPLLSATLLSLQALAQPVLDQAYHPQRGNQISFNSLIDTAQIVRPAHGASQTWNYTTLQSGPTIAGSYTHPNRGTMPTVFPQANNMLSFTFFGTTVQSYLRHDAQGAYFEGNTNGTTVTRYIPSMVAYVNGTTFGGRYDSQVLERTVRIGQTDTAYMRTSENFAYVGYGTLQLPNSVTYTNVILVKSKLSKATTPSPTGPTILADSGSVYYFLAPGAGYPMLQLFMGRTFGGTNPGPYKFGSYLSVLTVSNKPAISTSGIRLSPMPASSQVSIRLSEGDAAATARITDNAGRLVASLPIAAGTVNIAALTPGLYWVEVQGRQKVYRARLIKE